jgi:hypothetical protein
MRVKMKIRQKFKFTATAAILAFGVGNKGYTQNMSQAVMSVTATVVAGSHVSNNTISNFSDQIQGLNSKVTFGHLNLHFPDGAEYLVTQDDYVTMRGQNSNWVIKTNATQEKREDGRLTIQMSGDSLSKVPAGRFEGRHVTEIQYL